jgi:hypothetical protein
MTTFGASGGVRSLFKDNGAGGYSPFVGNRKPSQAFRSEVLVVVSGRKPESTFGEVAMTNGIPRSVGALKVT